MTICDGSGLLRTRSVAFEQFLIVSGGSHELRWALAALALRSLGALCTRGWALFVALARNVACRSGAARNFAPAYTRVPAARR